MTPKEKAKELFNKYATYVVMWAGDINTTHQNCKQCALIAVDEILNNFGLTANGQTFYTEYRTVQYYQEVKQEIEKL
jgi:hypothetical protein